MIQRRGFEVVLLVLVLLY